MAGVGGGGVRQALPGLHVPGQKSKNSQFELDLLGYYKSKRYQGRKIHLLGSSLV